MTGVYTNIARKRIEQSKEANSPDQSAGGTIITPLSPALPQTDQISGNHENLKSRIQENPNSGKPGNPKSGNHEFRVPASEFVKPEKYSTQLRAGLKQQLAVYATLNQMKDYEVLEAALDEFFERHK